MRLGEKYGCDLWNCESRIYAEIDAAGARGESAFKKRFDLGDGHNVQADIRDFTGPLDNQKRVYAGGLQFGINFWKDSEAYYRLDFDKNPTDTYLHEHFASGTRTMDEHLPLSGTPSISECVSMAFDKATTIIPWKFSGTTFTSGTAFSGFV
ncbi:hypothetical protein AUJ14_03225 [Candidatus Micrarchaeota archaeon CG1_02_55_22]|nr:MAG: hypothetical protein AUJ14_03225 [Candidatus Micrarchaeota archaeon CG1_02_55_22]